LSTIVGIDFHFKPGKAYFIDIFRVEG
jgi:hypothetical protein